MKAIYKKLICDVAMEISLATEWRRKIFGMKEEEVLEISYKEPSLLPEYIKDDIMAHKLTFFVKIVTESPVKFDDGLITFKFWAKGYPEICRYSGNNPNIL